MRLALVGCDGDHAEDFLRILNAEHRFDGVRVAHVWTDGRDLGAGLAARYGLTIDTDLRRLATYVDGALIVDRDGGRHLDHALPFVERGLPVFVDKPLACSASDARRLVRTAQDRGSVLVSGSALRWLPVLDRITEQAVECGPLTVTASGPADPHSPFGGGFFYGSHIVELLAELSRRLTGATPRLERVSADSGGVVLQGTRAGVDFRAHLLSTTSAAYAVHVTGRRSDVFAVVDLDDDYMVPVARTFVDAVTRGEWPLGPEELLRPIDALVAYSDAWTRRP